MKGKNLLVIGGGLMQVPIYLAGRDLGLRLVGMDRDGNAPAKSLSNEWIVQDISDEKSSLDAALRVHSHTSFDGVITVGTDFSTTVSLIAQTLGLRAHSYEAAKNAKDKVLMRQVLTKAGIPSPAFTFFNSVPPLAEDWTPYLPGVVKPADNMGARGVEKVEHGDEIPQAVERALKYSSKGKVLLERFIPGLEYSLDSLIGPDWFLPRGLADRDIRFPPRFIEMGHSFPSQADQRVQEDLWQCLESGARALGLTWGAAKGDLKWDNGPVVGEIAARLSGGFMSGWTFPLASGFNPVKEAILLALGTTPELLQSDRLKGVSEGAVISIPGTIARWEGAETVSKIPGVEAIFYQKQPGESVRFPQNNVEKAANILCSADSHILAEKIMIQVRRNLIPRLAAFEKETEVAIRSQSFPNAFDSRDLDWYGVTWNERLEDWERLTGGSWPKLSQSQAGEVKDFLRSGGIQGGLFYWDSYLC